MAITLKTVATASGTSVATASLALSDHPRVSAATRRRVQEVALRLGYRSRAELRARQQQRAIRRTRRIALVLVGPESRQRQHSEIVRHLLLPLSSRNLRVEVAVLDQASTPAAVGQQLAPLLKAKDGLLLYGAVDREAFAAAALLGRPTVLIGPVASQPLTAEAACRACCITYDEIAMGREAAERLLELGHRRLALVTARGTARLYYDRWEDGYRLALGRAGLPLDEALMDRSAGRNFAGGQCPLLALAAPPTAWLCPDVTIAERLRTVLAHHGRELPPAATILGGTPGNLHDLGFGDYPALMEDTDILLETCLDYLQQLAASPPGPVTNLVLPYLRRHLDRLAPPPAG
jgi:LacI family transcriptional regulator